eukprot:TRINITY_DN2715_c1_g1_i1.p1 TRINITY_DN2715_c1_g1~~TRINITY_DN2715_c1_g1_i1.p1  ORF type:complete len:242 (-),score=28.90 TRINITY_DN2715_c1_g1_i1:238-963(-)
MWGLLVQLQLRLPIVNGYVVSQGIRSMPLAGSNITAFVQEKLRERGEPLPQHSSLTVCREIKEKFCYTCRDIALEFARLDEETDTMVKQFRVPASGSAPKAVVDVAYERFLAPEVLFQPEIAKRDVPALPDLVDRAVQACPIDARRKLYSEIWLSGGSSMFRNLDRRLKVELQSIVDKRLSEQSSGVKVSVHRHPVSKYAVWLGGSMLSVAPTFPDLCHTRQEYEEHGPSICRRNHVMHDT